ncbi:hypothetical protein ACOXPP_003797 [Escherichia coli O141,141ab,141ac:H43]
MATNNFKAFALDPNANVMSQADWEALPTLLSGFTSGKASSAQVNKALRQATVMGSVLAQYIVDSSGADVLDDGNTALILSRLKSGLLSASPGRLLNVKVITSSGTYTPTAGTKTIIVECQGGGGAGGGASAGTTTNNSIGTGGGAGGYAKALLTPVPASVAVTIGSGGTPVSGNNPGGTGGTSSFGTYLVCQGGSGGVNDSRSAQAVTHRGGIGGVAQVTGATELVSMDGACGQGTTMVSATNGASGAGANSPFGGGGTGSNAQKAGTAATGYGAGGGGVLTIASSSGLGPYAGGAGTGGIVVVWEYA